MPSRWYNTLMNNPIHANIVSAVEGIRDGSYHLINSPTEYLDMELEDVGDAEDLVSDDILSLVQDVEDATYALQETVSALVSGVDGVREYGTY